MTGVLGLITARGGSKGIPRKNLRLVAGRPLIAWTLDAARASRLLNKVIVSTDDEEIAATCRDLQVDVPFIRPSALAGDNSPHLDVVLHAVDWMAANRQAHFDFVCLLQPTSPLRTAEDIDAAIELAIARRADAVVGMSLSPVHPFLMYRMDAAGAMSPFIAPDMAYLRRQDLPPAYLINGAIYVNRIESLRQARSFVPSRALGFVMPPERSLDVDDEAGLAAAERALLNRRTGKEPTARAVD